jgi:hypothetical protein
MESEKKILDRGELPITVASDVVRHLSIGLYRNFARAVKELISNSYDAGATEVKIKLDLLSKPPKIILRDNGHGMNKDDIENRFLKIGFPTPLTEKKDDLGRKRIGAFGIGCISVFPYCKTVKVISKKRNENKIIEVTIDADRFFKGGTFELGTDDANSRVPYKTYESDLPKNEGETIIILEDIKAHIIEDLKQSDISGKSSIEKYGGFQKFIWSLSQYIPIDFPPTRKDLNDFFNVPGRIPLKVWVNGEELFRNIPENAQILEKDEKSFDRIKLKYAIMSPLQPVRPGEAKGLQIRLRDVAIGLPTDFNIISLTGKVPGKLNWICGEIHMLEGLNSALMIDRDGFSFTKEVASIHDFFRERLKVWNDRLEKWAIEDKKIYESILELKDSEEIINKLKKSGILRISKERLRMRRDSLSKSSRKEILSPADELKESFVARGYKVISKKGIPSSEKAPVEINPYNKTVIIQEDHPDLSDILIIRKKKFNVAYDNWNPIEVPYSICKFDENKRKVIFNRSHPLFKSKLDEEIVKKLSFGFLLIAKGRKDKKQLLIQFHRLLEEIFLGNLNE